MTQNNELTLNDVLRELRKDISTIKTDLSSQISEVQSSLATTNKKIDTLTETVKNHDTRISNVETNVGNLKHQAKDFMSEVSERFNNQAKTIHELNSKIDYLEASNRRNNLVISGLPEKESEDRVSLATDLSNILAELLGWTGTITPFQVHRRGSLTDSHDSRRIVLKLNNTTDKYEILKNAYQLKGSKIYISQDFTPRQEKARYHLRTFIKQETHGQAKFISNFMVQLGTEKFMFDQLEEKVIKKTK